MRYTKITQKNRSSTSQNTWQVAVGVLSAPSGSGGVIAGSLRAAFI